MASLTGCAGMSGSVFKEIQEGDSTQKVMALYGEPLEFGVNPDYPEVKIWTYKKHGDICQFQIVADAVISSECKKDPSYVSPLAAFFIGFSKGMQNSARSNPPETNRNISCTANTIGGTTFANCY